MQKKRNDVKARTTLLLSLPDKHQLRFSKYKTTRELWAAILKTFSGNETTKKTKKNLLKQQYGNFKAKGSKTLEQTFNRLQVIVGQLQFMDVKIEHDDLNQKFLTSLALEWLMHTIVWRNRSDLDTMSLDDLYNHLKVYESKVQNKSKPNSQNMAFISSAKHKSRNEDGNTVCVPTASTNVPTGSASVATISQDTACAYIASQSSGKKISIQGSDVAGFDKLKVECFNCHKMGHFARECRALRSQDRRRRDNYRQGSKAKEQAPKALMAIDGIRQLESRLVEYKEIGVKYYEKIRTLEFRTKSNNECIKILKKKLETLKQEKEGVDGKLVGLLTALKDLDNLIESQRADKNKERLGYSAVPSPPAQIYSSPKKDLSWTGLLEFTNDTVTDYSRASPTIESTSGDDQNKNPSVSETVASPITPKPFIKFVKSKDSQSKSKTDKTETPKKPPVRQGVKQGTPRSKNNTHKSFISRPDVHKPYRSPMRPVRTHMNGEHPNRTSFNKPAHSYTNRPFQRKSAVKSQYRALWVPTVNRNFPPVNRKFSTGSRNFPTANRKFLTASRKFPTGSTKFFTTDMGMKGKAVKPSACSSQNNIDDKGYWDSGCSRHMTGNISYLSDYEPFDGGYVSFSQGGCKITGKGTIKTGKLEFENVYFVKDLKYNLFSVSQIYNNKNSVLFTDSKCIVLERDFKLLDDDNILLRTPRQHNMYSIDLNNIVPHKDLTCLVAKASVGECMLWHRRLGIKREFSNARTPQQKGVTEKRNRTLIEAARTMLADAKLPVTFWAEAVNTACYVQNRVLVNKSHNKTPYEFFNGRTLAIGFLKPFGCHVIILNTLDNLGKFEAKGDEGYFIGYSMSSKVFRVFNKRTKRVEENLHIEFLENKAIEKGVGPNWLFDIDSLTKSMNYVPVVDECTNSTNFLGTKDAAGQEVKKAVSTLRYIALPNWAHDAFLESSSSKSQDHCNTDVPKSSGNSNPTATSTIPSADQVETLIVESANPTAGSPVPTVCFTDSQEPSSETRLISKRVANQVETPSLDNILSQIIKYPYGQGESLGKGWSWKRCRPLSL
nr:ribonuclease H-like domain-containing protein [Tanacetum cinerariifolium]